MTSRRAPVPTRVRVPLAGVSWPPGGRARSLHVGRSGVLLGPTDGGPDGLLPVTGAGRGLVPGGICVPDAAEMRSVVEAVRDADVVDLSAWEVALAHAPRTDLTVRPGPVDPRAARRMAGLRADVPGPDGPMDPAPLRGLADGLAGAALAGDGDEVVRRLTVLVGAGPGSTPTGDDVVVGVLAALDRHDGSASRAAAGLLRDALPPLLGRTTTVSRHDLAAAVGGQFAERVHALVRALARPSLVPGVTRAALGWGATSGVDLARGVGAGAAAAVATRPDGGPRAGRTEPLASAVS